MRSVRRRQWSSAFGLLAGLSIIWAFAIPLFASPDEPAHVVRAISAAHGQFLGDEFGPDEVPPYPVPVDQEPWKPGLSVDVPGLYQKWGHIECLIFDWNAQQSADCLSFDGPSENLRAMTYVGRYPPAYYFIVGAVSWLTPAGSIELYAMRIVSSLLCAALLASAIVTLWSRCRAPLARVGVAVAITPMVMFLTGTVNANALEIAAGIGVWVHGIVLATQEEKDELDTTLLDRFGVAALVLVLSRPGSILWLGLAGLLVAFIAGLPKVRAWWRWTRARLWLAGLSFVLIAQLAWFLYAKTLDVRRTFIAVPINTPLSDDIRASLGSELTWLRQMIGVFGWLDAPAPALVFVVWISAIAAIVGIALVAAHRRILIAIAALIGFCVLVPVVYQVKLADSVGYFWQGRYLLPLAVGVPLLAGIGVATDGVTLPTSRTKRFALVTATLLVAGQWLALAQLLRRYSVGADGTIWFLTAARWSPPIPSVVLLLVNAAFLAVAVLWTSGRWSGSVDSEHV
jgi:hypothetical protein